MIGASLEGGGLSMPLQSPRSSPSPPASRPGDAHSRREASIKKNHIDRKGFEKSFRSSHRDTLISWQKGSMRPDRRRHRRSESAYRNRPSTGSELWPLPWPAEAPCTEPAEPD